MNNTVFCLHGCFSKVSKKCIRPNKHLDRWRFNPKSFAVSKQEKVNPRITLEFENRQLKTWARKCRSKAVQYFWGSFGNLAIWCTFFSLSKVIWLNDHQKEQKKGVKVKATLYKYTYYDSKLLVPVVCFPELFKTSSRTVWAQQHVLLTGFLPGQARRNWMYHCLNKRKRPLHSERTNILRDEPISKQISKSSTQHWSWLVTLTFTEIVTRFDRTFAFWFGFFW